MRTIQSLTEHPNEDRRIYVYLKDDQTGHAFLKQAEAEGFTYQDGEKPTKREYSMIMAVNPDKTLNFVGVVGRMAFGANASVAGKRLLRVDYARYAAGETDYEYKPA